MNVSVVIRCHNGEKYLSRAVTSLLAQTFRDIKLLIADGGLRGPRLES